MLQLKVLMENKTFRDGLVAEHGLSLLVEAVGRRILFDAGATGHLLHNMEQMKIDPRSIDLAIVSHGHYDHTGGLPAFAAANPTAPVYIHKEAFHAFFGEEDGKLDEVTCGIRWTEAEREAILARSILTEGPLWLDADTVISGTIPRPAGFAPTEPFFIREPDGSLRTDPMDHEQFLAIRDRAAGGVHVISGCSHTGPVQALRYAAALFPGENILSLTGGFHMYSAGDAARTAAVDALLAEAPATLVPLHCTGMKAICALRQRIGDRCLLPGAGDTVELG